MLKVLLISPPYYGFRSDSYFEPLGLLYIASYLIKKGVEVKLFDAQLSGADDKALLKEIESYQPTVVGCPTFTISLDYTYKCFNIVKKYNSEIVTITGGPHASLRAQEMINECDYLDYVVLYEGEKTFFNLLRGIIKKVNNIPNVVARNGSYYDARDRITKLDELPFPARHLLPDRVYKKNKSISLITSRGCPYKCRFCVTPNLLGSKVCFRTPENVLEEIIQCIDKYNISIIHFWDDTLTINNQRVSKICNLIKSLNLKWDCYIRPDTVNYKTLKTMKNAGCFWVRFGVETGNENFRLRLKGGRCYDRKFFQIVDWCNDLGILSSASYILGFPHETEDDVYNTIKFSQKLKTWTAGFYKFTPIVGSNYFSEIGRENIDYSNCHLFHIKKSFSPHISDNKLQILMKKAYMGFFNRKRFPNGEYLDNHDIRFWIKTK